MTEMPERLEVVSSKARKLEERNSNNIWQLLQ